ncbi:15262_t:CDS:2, partial [Rhizophagus irregularis]
YVSSFKLYAFDPQSAPYRYMLKYGIGNVQHNVVVLQLGMGMVRLVPFQFAISSASVP